MLFPKAELFYFDNFTGKENARAYSLPTSSKRTIYESVFTPSHDRIKGLLIMAKTCLQWQQRIRLCFWVEVRLHLSSNFAVFFITWESLLSRAVVHCWNTGFASTLEQSYYSVYIFFLLNLLWYNPMINN